MRVVRRRGAVGDRARVGGLARREEDEEARNKDARNKDARKKDARKKGARKKAKKKVAGTGVATEEKLEI